MASSAYPPTPAITSSTTSLPSTSTSLPTSTFPPPSSTTLPFSSTSIPVAPNTTTVPTSDSNAPVFIVDAPNTLLTPLTSTTIIPPTVMMASTMASNGTTAVVGVFGVAKSLDPAIIFALVVAGLVLLLLLCAVIYCCCSSCTEQHPTLVRTASLRSVVIQEPPPPKPLFLRASITPEYSFSSAQTPAASVFVEQPVRLTIGAYSADNGAAYDGGLVTTKVIASYPQTIRQEAVEPDVIVTRRAAPIDTNRIFLNTVSRKKYLYPANGFEIGNDLTYNTVGPSVITRGGNTPIITTLGDGYAVGRSLRSVGNRTSNRRFLLMDDSEPSVLSPRIISLD